MGKVTRREGKAISQENHRHGQLSGKVAIVSGAGQGIGRRIALRLGLAGAFVILADLYEKACSETVHWLNQAGVDQCMIFLTDVSQEDQVRHLAAKAQGLGGFTFLVNNAGIAGPTAQVEDITVEDWETTMAVNLRGVSCAASMQCR